jgi:SAM-dependent methyltransferase
MDIREIATNLRWDEQGFWVALEASPISYPSQGNDGAFAFEDSSFWFSHRTNCLLEVLSRFPPPGMLFDVGGGNGFVALALQNAGIEVALVEPGVDGVRNARQRGVNPVIHSTLQDAGFLPGTLPAVGLFDVLEHIQDDQGFLKMLRRLLRPDGRLYLTVPAYNFLWSSEDSEGGHYRRYTLRAMRHKLQKAGFTTEFDSYFFCILPFPIFLQRSLPAKLGFRSRIDLQQAQREHAHKRGWLGTLLEWIWDRELKVLRNGKGIKFGGSCLVVARSR